MCEIPVPPDDESVSSGTGHDNVDTWAPLPDPDPSPPFPLGEGTGGRVESVVAREVGEAVPDPKNRSGSGTLPFTIKRATSSAIQRSASNSWGPHDLRGTVVGLQHGTIDRPKPSVGRRTDGAFWLYAKRVNCLAGESGSGKTWTALTSVAAELEDGNAVVFLDLEDSEVGIVSRLLDLGVDGDVLADLARFAYVQPAEAFVDDLRAEFWSFLEWMKPSLVVLDSTGESMALEGVDPNADDQVAGWFRRVPNAIAARGPAVLIIDHLPKSDRAALSPIGAQRKKAALTGVLMTQTVRKGMSFARGRPGEAMLTCGKDRSGFFVTGEVVMRLTVTPEPARGDSGVSAVLRGATDDDWAPTRHMHDVSTFLESAAGPQTTGQIKRGVKGKSETLATALRVLVASGYLTASSGARNSVSYAFVQPYEFGDTYTVPDDVELGDGDRVCTHEWHDAVCKPEWCHSGHHGSCNRVDQMSCPRAESAGASQLWADESVGISYGRNVEGVEEGVAGVIKRAREEGRLTENPAPWEQEQEQGGGAE